LHQILCVGRFFLGLFLSLLPRQCSTAWWLGLAIGSTLQDAAMQPNASAR